MRNLFNVATITLLLLIVSCNSEENDYTINQVESVDLASDVYQDSNAGIYNGVFTTIDGAQRGSVEITIPADNSRNANATITLTSGEIISLFTNDLIQKDIMTQNIIFGDGATSLNFSVDADGKNPIVNEISFNDKESSVVIRKHTNRAPVVPIAGTFACTDCTGHPLLGTGVIQTFNLLMFTTPDGDSTFDTQTTLGMRVYDSTGTQSNCTANGPETTCDLSGSYTVPGGTITWSGLHTLNNEATGMQDCSGAVGTWTFASTAFGNLTGTFASDESCPPAPVMFVQDFDGSQPEWMATPSIPYFIDGVDAYSPTLIGGAAGSENITNPTFIGQFLFVRDLDSPMGTPEEATLIFSNVAINPTNASTISFDYDVLGYDGGDDVTYVVVLDAVDQPTVTLIDGANDGGTSAQGTETINIPAGASQIGFKLIVEQNGDSDYAGFDNFMIEN